MKDNNRKSNRSFELDKKSKRSFDLEKASVHKFALEKDADNTLAELKEELLADGVIDKEEVQTLRNELYADGVIDKEEAEFLFELNDAVSDKSNDPSWNEFFVEAISDYLLKDETSPGEIDEDEAKWLIDKIGGDGKVDGVEKTLLRNLSQKSKSMPKALETFMQANGISVKAKAAAKAKANVAVKPEPKPATPQKPQTPTQQTGSERNKDADETTSTSSKKWLWIILILAIVALAGYGIKQCGGTAPQAAEEATPEMLEAGQTTTADVDTTAMTSEEATPTEEEAETPAPQAAEENEGAEAISEPAPAEKEAPTAPVASTSEQAPAASTASQTADIPTDVEEAASRTIRGDYGNGEQRKACLGGRYGEIQAVVNNRLLR